MCQPVRGWADHLSVVRERQGGSVVADGASSGGRWAMAYERDPSGWRMTAMRHICLGQHLEIGRVGDMLLGVRVPNALVSRRAMCVTATDRGWVVTVTNKNGALLRPWCQPPQKAPQHELLIDWPLVAIQMLPSSGATQHWVLLEFEDLRIVQCDNLTGPLFPEIGEGQDVSTVDAVLPRGLTRAELEALHMVFAAQLHWPPNNSAPPMLLKQAASRLGISLSGLQDRLKAALDRACALGQDRRVVLTDPSYLYTLVRAGYLCPPTQFPHRQLSSAS